MTDTNHGNFDCLNGYWAARHALGPLSEYTAMLNAADNETTQREASSTLDKIGATAGVIGAIAGIAGLAKSSEKHEDVLGIDVINYCDYPVVPYKISSSKCSMNESPRTIYTSDNTLIQCAWGDGFVQNESEMKVHFVVGYEKTIKVHLHWLMGSHNRWTVDHVVIDDVRRDMEYDLNNKTDTLGCIDFDAEDGYPSFNVFFHTVMYDTAKSFIIFTKLGT